MHEEASVVGTMAYWKVSPQVRNGMLGAGGVSTLSSAPFSQPGGLKPASVWTTPKVIGLVGNWQ